MLAANVESLLFEQDFNRLMLLISKRKKKEEGKDRKRS